MWACTIALLPAFYIAAQAGTNLLGALAQVTEFAQRFYNLFVIVALMATLLRLRENRSIESWLLVVCAVCYMAPRMINWIGVNDRSTLDSITLTPYASFAFVLIAGWILISRFVRTLNDYEKLAAELEQRVIEKSQALRVQLAATELAREDAEKANLAKSHFLAAASHDLRQPLHALGLFAAALNEKTQDAEARQLRLRMVPTDVVVRSDPVLLERILRSLILYLLSTQPPALPGNAGSNP
jgi:signal transduction histidine kinase